MSKFLKVRHRETFTSFINLDNIAEIGKNAGHLTLFNREPNGDDFPVEVYYHPVGLS